MAESFNFGIQWNPKIFSKCWLRLLSINHSMFHESKLGSVNFMMEMFKPTWIWTAPKFTILHNVISLINSFKSEYFQNTQKSDRNHLIEDSSKLSCAIFTFHQNISVNTNIGISSKCCDLYFVGDRIFDVHTRWVFRASVFISFLFLLDFAWCNA